MKPTIYWIEGIPDGRLGIITRPRGGDWLEDEIMGLRGAGVDAVASFLEPREAAELELSQEREFCERHGIEYISFPIKDYGVPESHQEALGFAQTVLDRLKQGKSVVVHCRQGIGRAPTMAAAVMVLAGIPAAGIFDTLAKVRGRSVPDTEAQREWLMRFARRLSAAAGMG
jgi:rhodanese-related sulfurtransferase